MKKEMTLSSGNTAVVNIQKIVSTVTNGARVPIELLRKYYSQILEREIDKRQMLSLINVQVAFFFAAFPSDGPIVLRIVCCGWFLWALLKCKAALKCNQNI